MNETVTIYLLYLKVTEKVVATQGIFEVLSAKIGVVLLILGVMHFFNIYVLARLRQRGDRPELTQAPPLPPTQH